MQRSACFVADSAVELDDSCILSDERKLMECLMESLTKLAVQCDSLSGHMHVRPHALLPVTAASCMKSCISHVIKLVHDVCVCVCV